MTSPAAQLAAWAAPHRLIGLGESTHGTHEIFELKAEVIRCLVTDHDLAAVGLEASAAECARIDAYLQGADLDARDVLANQRFWTWDTEELLDLLVWLRRHNDRGGNVRLFGFDMQFPALAAQDCAELTTVPSSVLDALGYDASVDWFGKLPVAARAALADAAAAVAESVVAQSVDWQSVLTARSFAQGALMRSNPSDIWPIREESMAANVQQALAALPRNRPVALWAHNGHVGRGRYHDTLMMGGRLAERLGDEYFVVGLFCGAGTVRALGSSNAPEAVAMPAPRTDSVEATLDDTRQGVALLRGKSDARLNRAMREWVIGGVVSADPEQDTRVVVPSECYDAVAFTEESSATRANPTGARPSSADVVVHAGWYASTTGPRGSYDVCTAQADAITVSRNDSAVDWGYASLTADGMARVVSLRAQLPAARSAVVQVTESHAGEVAVQVLCSGPGSHTAQLELDGAGVSRVRLCLSGLGRLQIEGVTR